MVRFLRFKMNEDIKQNVLKSNTSIVGIVCKDGVVMAGDRRATAGNLIAMKNENKVAIINDYIVLSYTGSVADAHLSSRVIAAELKLKELKTKSRPTVKESANLLGMMTYRNIRTPSMIPAMVGTIIGGVNDDGSVELYSIEPAGSVVKVSDYDANFSSGMPFILGLLERQYKENISVKEGVELAKECLKASTQRDSGSGNGMDIVTITKDGIKKVVSEQIISQYK